MRYLGLDLGSRTLGLSISDPNGIIATSLGIIRHNEEYDKLVFEVKNIVEDKKIDEIVLGLPKNMNNTIGPKGELSYRFKDALESKIGIKVNLVDERLTTKQATDLLISNDTSRKKRKKVIDSMAATIILQSYLDMIKER
ncbi:MAG: Holliday junction resolvase RuvX [Bacilli bacterium]